MLGRAVDMSRTRSPVRCIVCDKAIAKRLTYIWFKDPEPARPAGMFGAAREAKIHGMREDGPILSYVYLDQFPTTKQEAQKYSNGQLISVRKRSDGSISEAAFWDGESYTKKYFCKDACAVKQGWASARHGDRFTWKD